jgi:predicted metal-dependent HD superfamily phosphohydrolase
MMTIEEQPILKAAHAWVETHYEAKVSEQYVYHNFQHILDVIKAVYDISAFYEISNPEQELLLLAAYFHDAGYDQGAFGHEDRGKAYARDFMEKHQQPKENIKIVEGIIEATRPQAQATTLLQKILRDADFSHVGSDQYWDRCSRVRQELLLTRQDFMAEDEWVDFELNFIRTHQFNTDAAFTLYEAKKQKNIKRLKKYRNRVKQATEQEAHSNHPKKKKKKKNRSELELKQINLGRGVETMFRTTYRTHLSLSSIADNKANIMLSINAIIISIVVSSLVPRFTENPKLILPTMLLLSVCLTALVFAILSTRPKVTEGTFSREDIKEKRSNLLFFGNFYRMDIEDFHWGMMEMIKDSDFLYSSMTRDLYFLGVVLAKKYQYLRICYSVFMYGLIIAVITFAIAYLT